MSRKIATAQDLAAVVRSMKALAASSIGPYEKAVAALHAYYRTVELGLSACVRSDSAPGVHAGTVVAVAAPTGRIGAIVFGSDQGLVGRFNEVLMDVALQSMHSLPGRPTRIWVVGERLQGLIPTTLRAAPQAWPLPASVDAITPLVGRILIDVAAACEHRDITELHVYHNRPRSAAAYEPAGRRLLPLDSAWLRGMSAVRWPTRSAPQVIDPAVPALAAFVREYMFVVLFQACAESLAAENASRLAAMQRAEKNIRELLDDLKGKYRRLRQESIDEELFEVIAGYESLAHGSSTGAQRTAAALPSGAARTRTTDAPIRADAQP